MSLSYLVCFSTSGIDPPDSGQADINAGTYLGSNNLFTNSQRSKGELIFEKRSVYSKCSSGGFQ